MTLQVYYFQAQQTQKFDKLCLLNNNVFLGEVLPSEKEPLVLSSFNKRKPGVIFIKIHFFRNLPMGPIS
jgi:hypothetical protein